jgi:hypothetical protein
MAIIDTEIACLDLLVAGFRCPIELTPFVRKNELRWKAVLHPPTNRGKRVLASHESDSLADALSGLGNKIDPRDIIRAEARRR